MKPKPVFAPRPVHTPAEMEKFSTELAQSIARKEFGVPDAKIVRHRVKEKGFFYSDYCFGTIVLVREIGDEREVYPFIGQSSLKQIKKSYCGKLPQTCNQDRKSFENFLDTYIASVKLSVKF